MRLIWEIIINSSRKQIAEVLTSYLLTTVSLSYVKLMVKCIVSKRTNWSFRKENYEWNTTIRHLLRHRWKGIFGGGLPVQFGHLARQLLMKLCWLPAYRIDFVFYRYTSPSIKDRHAGRSSDNDRYFGNIGSGENRPHDLLKAEKYFLQRTINIFSGHCLAGNMFCEILKEKVLLCKFVSCVVDDKMCRRMVTY